MANNIIKTITFRPDTGCGRLYVAVYYDDKQSKITGMHAHFGKNGSCWKAMMISKADLINLCIENGIDLNEVAERLVGHICYEKGRQHGIWHGKPIKSCIDALGKALKEAISQIKKPSE